MVLVLRDLRDLLVHLAHAAAAADHVREIVALAQFLAQVGVLLHQTLGFRLHQALDSHRLADHAGCTRRNLTIGS